ncbi:hypothetical protein H9P43_000487 [Blastocladiella emersonii ATCC 22665]|nr:hypothetical protein H9P43_000487 [Blastocladiella emersonii ATCC 22665]
MSFATTAPISAPPTAGGFSFTNLPAAGAPATPATATGTGFTFGAAAPASSAAAAPAPGGFSFGTLAPTPASSAAAPAPAFGAFGAPAASAPGGATPSLGFGAAKPFGATPAVTTAPSFGGFGAASGTPKPFGIGTLSGFGGSTLGQPQQQQQALMQQQQQANFSVPVGYPQRLPATPQSTIQSVREAWDPLSPNCQFKHYFYNLVHPSEVKKYTKGPNDDEKLWEHAVKNNPDPTCLVPALAVGFKDLEKRMTLQDQHLKNMQYRLGEIAITCEKLHQRHLVDTATRAMEYRRKHTEQAARLLKLLAKIQVLRAAGVPMSLDEDAIRAQFEQLAMLLRKPTRYAGQVAQLWRTVETNVRPAPGTDAMAVDGATLAQADVDQVTKVLAEQFQGIQHLVTVLKADAHDLDVVEKHLKADHDAVYKDK